jgi:hypothetical protein
VKWFGVWTLIGPLTDRIHAGLKLGQRIKGMQRLQALISCAFDNFRDTVKIRNRSIARHRDRSGLFISG